VTKHWACNCALFTAPNWQPLKSALSTLRQITGTGLYIAQSQPRTLSGTGMYIFMDKENHTSNRA
jgi:hypothetical protein